MEYDGTNTPYKKRTFEDNVQELGLLEAFYRKCIHNQIVTANLINSIDTKINIIIGILVYLIIKTW